MSKNQVYGLRVNVPECSVATKEQGKGQEERKEGERKYRKET